MIISHHQAVYRILKDKYGITSSSIIGDEKAFVVKVLEDVIKTQDDFTTKELEDVKLLIAKEIENAEKNAEADKAALLAKLGITADEAKLLLS
ncbi:hypothetical protein UFOVP1660_6 [uncultured Caudovirales phage]|uniref:Uncharacterized protein n=1 Tax=uncultured Caudovirales phage TaxID=2100421 RepID=A0A6J5T592_9CAUD|nr:hypothetical protein UFOVP1660_6 [uncultured Caudovirales phage]